MGLTIGAIVALGGLFLAAFIIIWVADARRADEVEHDPERLDTDMPLDEEPHLDPQRPLPGFRSPGP